MNKDTIADVKVAAKFNRLLRIENELAGQSRFAGGAAFQRGALREPR